MEIKHDTAGHKAWTEIDGNMASVEYILNEGVLDIQHTYVPAPLEGKGIASQLVKFVYDYACENGLEPAATCSYAQAWLKRHPDYEK